MTVIIICLFIDNTLPSFVKIGHATFCENRALSHIVVLSYSQIGHRCFSFQFENHTLPLFSNSWETTGTCSIMMQNLVQLDGSTALDDVDNEELDIK